MLSSNVDDLLYGFMPEAEGAIVNIIKEFSVGKEEMDEFHKHQVYKKVPIAICFEVTGKKPVSVRWVDTNKGD